MNGPETGTAAAGRFFRRNRPPRLRRLIWLRRRPIRPVLAVIAFVAIAVVPWTIRRLQEAPKVEPPFETIVGDGAGPDQHFGLSDTDSRAHDRATWAGRPAIVTQEQITPVLNETVTFAKDVAPILWKNCGRCHRPGQVAPFSLLSFQDAAKRADFIIDVIDANRMPPWKPHPGAGVFLDAPRLSVLEKETLRAWAANGCAAGDPADLPPQPVYNDGWQLGQPDVVLTMPEPHEIPADGPDVYRAFCLGSAFDRDSTITAIEFRPGNRRVVHHSRTYLDITSDARRLDRSDPEPGYAGRAGLSGGMELPYPGIGAWTPGMTARFAPDGCGRLIPAGSDIVLQVHYHPTGKPERDQSQVGLFLAKKPVARTMAGYSLCTDQLDIPPGVKRHRVLLSTRLKADVHLYSVVPHAHYLCRELRLAATLPDGSTHPLLWITDWDFDWQDQYRYARPVRLPKDTVVTLAAYFDNTAENPRNPHRPPRRVRYGISTKDEMCACHLEFMPDDPSGYKAYPLKSPFGL